MNNALEINYLGILSALKFFYFLGIFCLVNEISNVDHVLFISRYSYDEY